MLTNIIEELKVELRKRSIAQGHINTFCDALVRLLTRKAHNNDLTDTESDYLEILLQSYLPGKRYMSWEERQLSLQDTSLTVFTDDKLYYNACLSQGVKECMKWKGKPLFKTANDLVILNTILWDLKPSTIIELGSGKGESARYMQDMMHLYNVDVNIFSFDINMPVETKEGNISFFQGDCSKIDTLKRVDYSTLPHPWLIVEDAHVNISSVISFLVEHGQAGDIIFIEDSENFQNDVENLLTSIPNLYIDTHYVD